MCNAKDCSAFFKEFDDKFLHKRTPQIQADITTILNQLTARRDARASGNAIPKNNKAQKQATKRLADEQLKIITKHFTKNKKLDLDCIQSCFAMFANGELRQPAKPGGGNDRPGEPNGDFYFLFAEFATMAIEDGVDVAIWTELLRTFVKTQEIFIQVYPPRGGGKNFGRPRRFKGPSIGVKAKKALHDKYKKKSAKELLDEYQKNLKKANKQVSVAFLWPGERERYALAIVNRRVDEIVMLARNLVRSDELTAMASERWRTFAGVIDLMRGYFIASAEPDTGRQGFLGEPSSGNYRELIDDLTASGSAEDLIYHICEAEPADDATMAEIPDNEIRRIEGIDDTLAANLSNADISDLQELARVDHELVKVEGISANRLQQFSNMAELLVRFPQLDGDDAELMVRGLGYNGLDDLLEKSQMIEEKELTKAMAKVKLPNDYDPANVIGILETLLGEK